MNLLQQPVLNPLIVPAGTGQPLDLGDHRGHITISAEATGGVLLLAAGEADPDGGVPPHVHHREDEIFYILSGRFAFEVGALAAEAGPGDCVFAPRHVPHTWRCLGPEPGRLLTLFTPGANFETFIRAMAQMGGVPSDPASLGEALALAARHGIEMLPPSPAKALNSPPFS